VIQSLEPALIEHIHDVLVSSFLPFDEKVNPAEYRNIAFIEAASARPFQTVFGDDAYPTLSDKPLHCFIH